MSNGVAHWRDRHYIGHITLQERLFIVNSIEKKQKKKRWPGIRTSSDSIVWPIQLGFEWANTHTHIQSVPTYHILTTRTRRERKRALEEGGKSQRRRRSIFGLRVPNSLAGHQGKTFGRRHQIQSCCGCVCLCACIQLPIDWSSDSACVPEVECDGKRLWASYNYVTSRLDSILKKASQSILMQVNQMKLVNVWYAIST